MPNDIFTYSNYRTYLNDFLEAKIAAGESFRSLAKMADIKSPNFLQLVLKGRRNFTIKSANSFADGLKFSPNEKEYFVSLVRLEHDETAPREEILRIMLKCVGKARGIKVKDDDVFSHWLYPTLLELTRVKSIKLDPENISKILKKPTSKEDVEQALQYLIKKGYIEETQEPGVYTKSNISFETENDVRRIAIQKHHSDFLEMARHRINDPIEDREFQSLTTAIPLKRMDYLKQKLRSVLDDLNDEFDAEKDHDTVVHIICCAFKLIKD